MNITRFGKWLVGIAAGTGVTLGTWKNVFEIAKNLNGWHVLAILSTLVLLGLAVDFFRQWLDRRFSDLKAALSAATEKEQKDRMGWVAAVQNQNNDIRARLDKIESSPTSSSVRS